MVRERRAKSLLQVSTLPLEKQVELEDANVLASLHYARKEVEDLVVEHVSTAGATCKARLEERDAQALKADLHWQWAPSP